MPVRNGTDLTRLDGIDDLGPRELALLTPEVVARWTDRLADDDMVDATEIVRLERQRLLALQTIRQGAELTDLEFKMVRHLQRHEGRPRSYLQIAQHLWGSTRVPITGRMLRHQDGYASPYIRHIWVLVAEIRRKLEVDPARPQHLATLRGAGYVWHASPPSLDDGVDYAARTHAALAIRSALRRDFGLELDGEVPFGPSPQLGPNHRDYQTETIEGTTLGRGVSTPRIDA